MARFARFDATVSARIIVSKTLYGTFHVHHLLETSFISESTKYFTNQDERKVALIFG